MSARECVCVCVALASLWLSACGGGAQVRPDPLGALASVASVPESEGPWGALVGGRSGEALEGFRAAAAAAPAGAQKARLQFGLGEAAWLSGRYEEAVSAHVEAVRGDPGGPLVGWSLLRLLELRGLSPGSREAMWPAVEAVEGAEQGPELWARAQAKALGAWIERQRWEGSESQAPFEGARWGQPTRWRVVGPVSVHPNLDTLSEELSAPERDEVMGEGYALLGFERRASTLEVSGDQARWRAGISGVYVAEAWVRLDREEVVDLSVFAYGNMLLRVDGQEVWRRDERGELPPVSAPLEGLRLSAGWHRVQVRLGYVRGYKEFFGVRFLPRGGGALQMAERPPEGFEAGRVLVPGRAGEWMGEGFSASALKGRALGMGLAAIRATSVYDEDAALGLLEGLSGEVEGSGYVGLLEASWWAVRWSAPGALRTREMIASLRRASGDDPGGARARLWLLELLRQQERREDAAGLVEELLGSSREEAAVWLEAATYYGWRGLSEREEAALSRAVSLAPESCDAKSRLYEAWRGRDYTPEEGDLPGGWEGCDWLRLRVAIDRSRLGGDPEEYLFHVKRQVTRSPWVPGGWALLARATRDLRDPEAALEVVGEGRALHPEDGELALLEADLRLELGDQAGARGVLERALARDGGSAALHRRLALLGGALPLEELRVDGAAAIKDAEAQGKPLNSAAFYALDYMARRYFEDGSHVDLIHLVTGVRSKEGINQRGEVSFPRGALPLLVRTIKRDGRVLEPQAQEGKASISLEGLEPGDYIEHAWLDFSEPMVTRQGATVGADFYFRMDDIASARSEFVVEVPASWDPQFVAQNLPPEAEVSTHGPWRRYRFVRTGSSEPHPEPDAVPKEEYLPHLQVLHRYGWEDALRGLQDQLAGATALTPTLRARAEAVVARAKSKKKSKKFQRVDEVRALFQDVVRHVIKPSPRDFSTDVAHVEMSREGNPVLLLQALLKARGIKSEVVLVKPQSQRPEDGPVPDLRLYSFTALRVLLPNQEPLWLAPMSAWAPFGLLPPMMERSPGIVLEPGGELARVQTPAGDPERELRRLRLELTLNEAGDLSGTITETLDGFNAMSRRAQYNDMSSEEQLTRFVEQSLNYEISGASLLEWKIEDREDINKPLKLIMKFTRPGYARADADGALIIEDRYDLPDLTRRHARLPERAIPMLLGRRDQLVEWRLEAPPGKTIALSGPAEVALESPFGSYVRGASSTQGALELRQRLQMPVQRVSVEDYPGFAAWAGDVDRASYLRVEIK